MVLKCLVRVSVSLIFGSNIILIFFYSMFCIILTSIKLRLRTYLNTFGGYNTTSSWDDLDEESIIEICEGCSRHVYPLDWLKKEVIHRKNEELPSPNLDNPLCIRCSESLRRVVEEEKCTICTKKLIFNEKLESISYMKQTLLLNYQIEMNF